MSLNCLADLFAQGYALQFTFFTQNEFLVHFILFMLWGFALVAFSFAFSALFGKVSLLAAREGK